MKISIDVPSDDLVKLIRLVNDLTRIDDRIVGMEHDLSVTSSKLSGIEFKLSELDKKLFKDKSSLEV